MDIHQARAWLSRDTCSVYLHRSLQRRSSRSTQAAPQRLIVWRSVVSPEFRTGGREQLETSEMHSGVKHHGEQIHGFRQINFTEATATGSDSMFQLSRLSRSACTVRPQLRSIPRVGAYLSYRTYNLLSYPAFRVGILKLDFRILP
jgi:hypothetical protein